MEHIKERVICLLYATTEQSQPRFYIVKSKHFMFIDWSRALCNNKEGFVCVNMNRIPCLLEVIFGALNVFGIEVKSYTRLTSPVSNNCSQNTNVVLLLRRALKTIG